MNKPTSTRQRVKCSPRQRVKCSPRQRVSCSPQQRAKCPPRQRVFVPEQMRQPLLMEQMRQMRQQPVNLLTDVVHSVQHSRRPLIDLVHSVQHSLRGLHTFNTSILLWTWWFTTGPRSSGRISRSGNTTVLCDKKFSIFSGNSS